MEFPSPGPDNPFQAPRSRLGPGPGASPIALDDESTRKLHLVHEVLIETLGSLGVILAIVAAILGVVLGLVALGPESSSIRRDFGIAAAISLAVCIVVGGVGHGLGRRQSWARMASAGLIGLFTLAILAWVEWLVFRGARIFDAPARLIPLGMLVLGAWSLLYVLLSPKGRFVFSPAFAGVVSRTGPAPGKPSPILLLAAVLVLLMIGAGAIIPLVNPVRPSGRPDDPALPGAVSTPELQGAAHRAK